MPKQLLAQNRAWAQAQTARDPEYFHRLAARQHPRFLWIGCADSRVPASEIAGVHPGEMFEHRNVANVVVHSDLNCLSVLQYGVEVLRVEHVIVCGHYGCGGVEAALEDRRFGLIDNWLRHVQDVREQHHDELTALPTHAQRAKRLCELNVAEQVVNVCRSTILQHAWDEGHGVAVHGWIYGLEDGLLRELTPPIRSTAALHQWRAGTGV
jgi:carbonic anhydrase